MSGRLRGAAHALLTRAIRGRRERGGEWGEALLAEFDQVGLGAGPAANREVLRWTFGGLRVAWRERRAARKLRIAALSRPVRLLRRTVYALVIAAVLAWPAQAYVGTVAYESSDSMAPTIAVGQRYLVDRVSYRVTGLHRGDIVLVHLTESGVHFSAMRRVVGLPGDRIGCATGTVVYRTGTAPTGTYVGDQNTDCDPSTVGPGQVYLLGDNLQTALDSRDLGPIPLSAVYGRVVTRV